jgi:CDP-diacylglycerol--serine O-phosphatidyltransferase
MKKKLPNGITLLNLISGSIAVMWASTGHVELAGYFILAGIMFDFLDGLAARLLGVQSELGKELDSLADMVTSGVAPGIIMFQLLRDSFMNWNTSPAIPTELSSLLPYTGLILTLGAGYRLAKFNLDPRQHEGFIGLPTPAMTLFVLSIPFVRHYGPDFFIPLISHPLFLLASSLVGALMMNVSLPMFSLKFKDFSFWHNKLKYLFIGFSAILILGLGFGAFLILIPLYILSSIIKNQKKQ